MSDSEMERLDSVLAAACKIAQSNKLDKKEREQQVRNFQMRCLELVDIMATSDTIPTHLLQVRVQTQSATLGCSCVHLRLLLLTRTLWSL